jgi:hypothetical protein
MQIGEQRVRGLVDSAVRLRSARCCSYERASGRDNAAPAPALQLPPGDNSGQIEVTLVVSLLHLNLWFEIEGDIPPA